jgi:hypothetical protein
MRLNHYERAMQDIREGQTLLSKVGARGLLLEARLQEAELLLETGKIQDSMLVCRKAIDESRGMGMQLLEAHGLRIKGKANLLTGHPIEAETSFNESLHLVKTSGAELEIGTVLLCLARLYARYPEVDGFRSRFEPARRQALALFRRIGADKDSEEASRLELGEVG